LVAAQKAETVLIRTVVPSTGACGRSCLKTLAKEPEKVR
jgi:hypothetical protein